MLNKNNIEKDTFGEMMKNRLENAHEPVDEGLWADIEQRMHKKRRVIPFWLWKTLGGIAAITFIVLTLRPFSNFLPNNSDVVEPVSQNNDIKTDGINMPAKESEISFSQNKQTVTVSKTIDKLKRNSAAISSNKNQLISKIDTTNTEDRNNLTEKKNRFENLDSNPVNETDLAINSKNENSAENKEVKNNSEEKGAITVKPDIKRYDHLEDYQIDNNKIYEAPKQSLEKPMLAASFGSGNGAKLSSFGDMDAAPLYESIVNADTKYSRIMAAADFTTTTYLPPVSFGLKISKEIAKNWSVESGLVYTYMSSIYKDAIYQNIKADLNLHYLGVPVNLTYNIAHNKKWNIYISGGGMIEKGLRSIYNQRTLEGNYEYTTVAKTKIDGIQLSVSSATGFSYFVYNDIALYAEPSITYYFKNNQPMSARTDQPLVVGFNAGLRFRL